MYSLYCSFEHEGFFFTECFDFLNESQLLQLRKRSFQEKKTQTKPEQPPQPLLVFSSAPKEMEVLSTQLLD